MIQQRPGDLLEVEFNRGTYYVVVLTKIVQFGGNVVFAHHLHGKRSLHELSSSRAGFNVCTDLLLPKRTGRVRRIHTFPDVDTFWLTDLVKSENAINGKPTQWFIKKLGDDDWRRKNPNRLTKAERSAMDSGCHSFDVVVDLIRGKYTPDQNPLLPKRSSPSSRA